MHCFILFLSKFTRIQMQNAAMSMELPADSTLVSDALDGLGLPGIVSGLQPLTSHRALCGRVVTVQIGPALHDNPSEGSHLGAKAISMAKPGDIIVVANQGNKDAACWGGLLSRAASLKGICGAVIDGLGRDVDECQLLGFPVFARGASPKTARGRFVEVGTQIPLDISGVKVEPDDWVVADGSGVVFIPGKRLWEICARANELAIKETRMIRRIESGSAVQTVLDRRYEEMVFNDG
jgi:regulator of RNase E activity RraA